MASPSLRWQEGGIQTRKVFVYDTDGTNLMQVLSNRLVDHTRTISNDMLEILSVGARRVRCGLPLALGELRLRVRSVVL